MLPEVRLLLEANLETSKIEDWHELLPGHYAALRHAPDDVLDAFLAASARASAIREGPSHQWKKLV